jgi:ribosome-associated protein
MKETVPEGTWRVSTICRGGKVLESNTLGLLNELYWLLRDKEAEDICILDMQKTPIPTDYFAIGTANSQTHLAALRDAAVAFFDEREIPLLFYDKGKNYDWLVIDAGFIVVHVFSKKGRKFFALEDLWIRSERVSFGG